MTKLWINMGPQHPMTHGLWNLKILVDGETIVDAEPVLGYLHRGVEKLCERRTYNQIIPLADRLCYVSSLCFAHAYCLTVEEMMDLEIPERAKYLRVIALEMQRLTSHMTWLMAIGPDVGLITLLLYCLREREYFLDLLQLQTGARMNQNYPRIGGVSQDIPSNFEHKVNKIFDKFKVRVKDYHKVTNESSAFLKRMQGVGTLSVEDAIAYGVTGPNLRGSGAKLDMREHDPYEVYDELDWEIQVRDEGDSLARFHVRMGEMQESCKIILQALKKMPDGPINVKAPMRPEGQAFRRTEDSRGEVSYYVVGNGGESPYRLKVRSPIFCTMNVLPKLLTGVNVADVVAIMGSIDVCIGETDK
ncbi:MAG: NADH-quinone oxidoreductase subunit NuoD [Thermoplasmata archaeon]